MCIIIIYNINVSYNYLLQVYKAVKGKVLLTIDTLMQSHPEYVSLESDNGMGIMSEGRDTHLQLVKLIYEDTLYAT